MADSGGNDILTERDVEFSTALRGYDRREVDAYVRRLRARAGHLAAELAEKEQRLSEVGGDASVPLQVAGSGNIGARVERIIAQAEHEAKEIREQAEKDAADIRKAYEDLAEEARRQREEQAKRAETEAREMIRRAEQEVARLRTARQTVLDQLMEIGTIIDGASMHAARTPELHPSSKEVLAIGPATAKSEQDAAPAAPEPRKPNETGKINPAILAAKARREAKRAEGAEEAGAKG